MAYTVLAWQIPIRSERPLSTFFLLWPQTLTYNLDLDMVQVYEVPAHQISRLKFISSQSYRPDRHTHNWATTLPGPWSGQLQADVERQKQSYLHEVNNLDILSNNYNVVSYSCICAKYWFNRFHPCTTLHSNYYYYYIRLTALFPGQPGKAGSKKSKLFWIFMKQEMAMTSAGPYADHLHLASAR